MSARDVIEMLAVAHRGLSEAETNFDERLRRDSMQVLTRAVQHPDAPALFGAMQLAFDESYEGNDPTMEDNGDGVIDPSEDGEVVDEDSPAGGPANEGITDDSSDDEESTDMNDGDGKDKDGSEVGAIVSGGRPRDLIAAAVANFQRLRRSA